MTHKKYLVNASFLIVISLFGSYYIIKTFGNEEKSPLNFQDNTFISINNSAKTFARYKSRLTQGDELWSDDYREALRILNEKELTEVITRRLLALLEKAEQEDFREAKILKQLCILDGLFKAYNSSDFLSRMEEADNAENLDAQFILALYEYAKTSKGQNELPCSIKDLALMGHDLSLILMISQASEMRNEEEYAFWISKAEFYQLPYALRARGFFYKESGNYDLAIKYFKQASELNDLVSEFALSYIYFDLFEVENESNKEKAILFLNQSFKYLEKSAQSGHGPSEYTFGAATLVKMHPYHQLNLPIKDMQKKAFVFLRRSYENDQFLEAGEMVAKCYIEGIGTTKNITKGKELLTELHKKGYKYWSFYEQDGTRIIDE
ncbi:MAG: hypothetical protein SNJ29_15705 [Rikenellaceae bacterium]